MRMRRRNHLNTHTYPAHGPNVLFIDLFSCAMLKMAKDARRDWVTAAAAAAAPSP